MDEGGFDGNGGCGCFLLHELMHKNGMTVLQDNEAKELDIENAMIKIQRVVLKALPGRLCKGYGVN